MPYVYPSYTPRPRYTTRVVTPDDGYPRRHSGGWFPSSMPANYQYSRDRVSYVPRDNAGLHAHAAARRPSRLDSHGVWESTFRHIRHEGEFRGALGRMLGSGWHGEHLGRLFKEIHSAYVHLARHGGVSNAATLDYLAFLREISPNLDTTVTPLLVSRLSEVRQRADLHGRSGEQVRDALLSCLRSIQRKIEDTRGHAHTYRDYFRARDVEGMVADQVSSEIDRLRGRRFRAFRRDAGPWADAAMAYWDLGRSFRA